jgi:hypothetical protein
MAAVKSNLWSLNSMGLIRFDPNQPRLGIDTKIMALFTEEDLQIALNTKL